MSPKITPATNVSFCVFFVIVNSVIAILLLNDTGSGYSPKVLALSIILFVYALIFFIVESDSEIEKNRLCSAIVFMLPTISLMVMSYIFFEYTRRGMISFPPDRSTLNIIEVLPSNHYEPDLRAILEKINIHRGATILMDGQVDLWVLILSAAGPDKIPYEQIPVTERGILYIYAFLMWIAQGYYVYIMLLANWAAHILSALLIYCLCYPKLGRRVSLIIAGVFAIFPENLYWGATIYKDGFSILLVLLLIYANDCVKNGAVKYVIIFSIALITLAFLRSGLIVPLILICFALSALGKRNEVFRRLATYLVMIASTTALFWIIMPGPVVGDIAERALNRPYSKLVKGSSSHLDVQNITYATSKDESLLEKVGGGDLNVNKLHYLPARVVNYLVAPFPPLKRGVSSDIYIVPSALFISLLLVPFVAGIFQDLVSRRHIILEFAIPFVVLSVAVAFAGPFVYERYRLVVTPFFLIIGINSLYTATARLRKQLIVLSLLTWVVMFFLWYSMKL
jgi:hypothetical protein